jgi:pimeloyl-ACP methyl ester carboxylesterase
LRPRSGRNYPTEHALTYAVETEPGVFAIVYRLSQDSLLSRPPRGASRAVLYVANQSSDAELREEPLVRELLKAEPNSAFFACDVRGIGDSRPDTGNADSFRNPYGSDYFYAIHSIMLDDSYVGQKTHDVLRVLAWLESYGHSEVHLAAVGWGALPATFAAMLSEQVTQVTLKNALTSYEDLAQSELYSWPLSAFVPNVLAAFDLPDCYRALESKKLRQIEPWGGTRPRS